MGDKVRNLSNCHEGLNHVSINISCCNMIIGSPMPRTSEVDMLPKTCAAWEKGTVEETT